MRTAAGFGQRLQQAMEAAGLDGERDLARAIRVSTPTAHALLISSRPVVDAATAFKIKEVTHFRVGWLLWGTGPEREEPDEHRLIELIRAQPEDKRDAIYDRILDLLHS